MGVGDVQARRAEAIRARWGPGPFTVGELAERGLTRSQVRSLVRCGAAIVVRRGVIALAGDEPVAGVLADDAPSIRPSGLVLGRGPAWERMLADHLQLVRAALLAVGPQAVVSHDSAAIVHGLPVARVPRAVSLLIPGEPNRRDDRLLVRGVSALPEQVVDVGGIVVTDVVRTCIDQARSRSLPEALVHLDAAARRMVMERVGPRISAVRAAAPHPATASWTRGLLADGHRSVWGWPGSKVLHHAVGLADPGSESPGESWWRGRIIEAGLPLPSVGYPVRGQSGKGYFADLAWPEVGVLGEVDGWIKYDPSVVDVKEALRRERARQRDLEAAGWRVIRWATDERAADVLVVVARVTAGAGQLASAG